MDLTWANPAASGRVSRWEVSPEETFSGHLDIVMDVAVGDARDDRLSGMRGPGSSSERRKNFPRWTVTHGDEDLMTAAAMS